MLAAGRAKTDGADVSVPSTARVDLDELHERLRAALPRLTIEMVALEHSGTGDCHPALAIESSERKRDHVYRMVVGIIDGKVNFFVHIHGESSDLTTEGTHRYSKEGASTDEVFAIVHSCFTEEGPS